MGLDELYLSVAVAVAQRQSLFRLSFLSGIWRSFSSIARCFSGGSSLFDGQFAPGHKMGQMPLYGGDNQIRR